MFGRRKREARRARRGRALRFIVIGAVVIFLIVALSNQIIT